MIRALVKYLIEGETAAARLLLPIIAGLFTVLFVVASGLATEPAVYTDVLYVKGENPPDALDRARQPAYGELHAVAGDVGATEWLQTQLQGDLKTVEQGGTVDPRLGSDADWKNAGLQRWTTDYLCPVRGWDRNTGAIRALVARGVGECPLSDRVLARIPVVAWFGAGPGLAVLAALLAAAALLWGLTFSFHHTRSAFRWLYRSKVF